MTESARYDVVLGAAPSGLEARRRVVRRGDPPSGGKRRPSATNYSSRAVPTTRLSCGSREVGGTGVPMARSKASGTTTAALDEDLETPALEAFFVQAS